MSSVLFPPVTLSRYEAECGVRALLQAHGYRLQQAFDLACADLRGERAPCPHHQGEPCTCHLVTWLVYDPAQRLVGVLVLHGHDNRTRARWSPTHSHAPTADPVVRLLARWARGHGRPSGGEPCP